MRNKKKGRMNKNNLNMRNKRKIIIIKNFMMNKVKQIKYLSIIKYSVFKKIQTLKTLYKKSNNKDSKLLKWIKLNEFIIYGINLKLKDKIMQVKILKHKLKMHHKMFNKHRKNINHNFKHHKKGKCCKLIILMFGILGISFVLFAY